MSFNKISRARNLLKEARASIGKIQLDPEVHGALLIMLLGMNDALAEAIATLDALPPKPRPGPPALVYSRKISVNG